MSTLLVLGYPTEDKAKQAYQEVLNLDNDLIVNLQSIAVVAKRDNDKFDVVTPGQPVGNSTVWGLFWGMLFGLIFLIPFWGAAIGAGLGAITGFFVKRGVDEDFQNRVRGLLNGKDTAAVFMVVNSMTEDKFAEAMRPFGGDILQTSLSSRISSSISSGFNVSIPFWFFCIYSSTSSLNPKRSVGASLLIPSGRPIVYRTPFRVISGTRKCPFLASIRLINSQSDS